MSPGEEAGETSLALKPRRGAQTKGPKFGCDGYRKDGGEGS